jgi:YVTN family beta-propeller protein
VGGPLALPASSSSRSMQQVHKVEWQRRMKPARPVVLSIICTALLVGLPGCRSGAFPHYPSNYREYAYVANGGSNTVSVLDVVDMRQQGLLTVGPHPVALVANPVRNQVYTINRGALPGGAAAGPAGRQRGSVSVIDAEQNLVKATIPVGLLPAAAAMDAGGTRLFVANAGSNNVSVVDPVRQQVLATAGVGEGPGALAVSPDGRTLVVANRKSGSVSLLELSAPGAAFAEPVVRSSFDGCPGAGSVAVLPDSSKAFVACANGHQVMVLGLATQVVPVKAKGGPPPGEALPDRLLTFLDVGENPVKLVLKPDGGEIFVLNQSANTISEIATGTNEVGGATLIGVQPEDGLVSADNSILWVANQGSDTIEAYSVDDGRRMHTVHVGAGPGPVAFSANGNVLMAVDTRSGDVSVVRTFSRNLEREPVYGTLFTLLPAGKGPDAIVDKAFKLGN